MIRTLLALALLAGCTDPAPSDDAEAIEITGYLDASRTSFTVDGPDALAIGLPEATEAGAEVVLENGDTGASAQEVATDDGAFVLAVPAALGDVLRLALAGGDGSEAVEHEVPDHPPFPDHASAGATLLDHEAELVIVFDAPLAGELVASHAGSGASVVLDAHLDGAEHRGLLPAASGDLLRVHHLPESGVPSAALALVVAAP